MWELGYVFKVITVAYRNVLLSLAGFHFFCSLEGEFIFLNPELPGYPGEFLSSTGLNCLLISETVCSVAKALVTALVIFRFRPQPHSSIL